MKIYSYNVNGIRAAVGKGLTEWLKAEMPDVLCIQETKAQPDQIDTWPFELLGYHCYWYSAQKKGYSGVAILSLKEPDNVEYGMGMPLYDNEGRFIRADFGDLSVISVYHPSGTSGDERQDFKMKWLTDFRQYINELRITRPNLLISGDYNIAHAPIDIHDPIGNAKNSGFLPEEREWMTDFLSDGYIDTFRILYPEQKDIYSWWTYRFSARSRNKGWRIDYHMATDTLKPRIKEAGILTEVTHSDHCPISVEINL